MAAPRQYHHGNLKEALLSAAIVLIGEVGPAGFTLREVARRAGVSHNAPYRHYRDRDELLAEVARQGFEDLIRFVGTAAERETTALDRFRAAGRAYVKFALRQKEHFTVMFDRLPDPEPYPQRTAAGEQSFALLVEFVRACQLEGTIVQGDPEQLSLKVWSLVHGIAKLAVAGFLKLKRTSDILAFTDEAMAAALFGLIPK